MTPRAQGTQETFVNVVGLVGGYAFLRLVGSNVGGAPSVLTTAAWTWGAFVVLTAGAPSISASIEVTSAVGSLDRGSPRRI